MDATGYQSQAYPKKIHLTHSLRCLCLVLCSTVRKSWRNADLRCVYFILLDFLWIFGAMLLVGYRSELVERWTVSFREIARHKRACVLFIAICPILIRLALIPRLGIPEPEIHDEFSYLLGAETFLHGRLANPFHPMWRYFETFHVNFIPTYTSKYPPAPAAFLALGWKLFGHPWAGVLLSVAFMAGSVCWMLQGWLPAAWALLGALIVVMQIGVLQYWTNSYWGGAVAAGAGALVLGALPRIQASLRLSDGIPFAIGMAVLANSRPYEGLVVVLATIPLLICSSHMKSYRWLIPVITSGVLTALFMGYYNYRLTGDPFTLPYRLHELRYGVVPLFWLGKPNQVIPQYTYEVFRQYWAVWDVAIYNSMRSDIWYYSWLKLTVIFGFYIRSWPLTIPLATVPFLASSKRLRVPLAILMFFVLCLFLEKAILPHYFAPVVAAFFLLLIAALRLLSTWKFDRTLNGKMLIAIIITAFVGQFCRDMLLQQSPAITDTTTFAFRRRHVLESLQKTSGHHLVLVQYGANHSFHEEWVYNDADIDGSMVVWAHDIDPARNQPLLNYYPDRTVWRLDPEDPNIQLVRIR
jgi:hypothetical protein